VDEAARAWIARVTGAPEVHRLRSLRFGITSDLSLVDADGRGMVLRRWDRPELLAGHPHAVTNEWRALEAARAVLGSVVPAPIAADPSGQAAGCPSLLMTFLPGTPVVARLDVRRLAAPAATLHHAGPPSGLNPARRVPDPGRRTVPAWTSSPAAWEALLDLAHRPEPSAAAVFLHGDYHPGNVLWSHRDISGIVDWPAARVGPAGVDVAHTRTNLALVDGVAAAAGYLAAYAALVPDYRHDVWWDAVDLFGLVDDFAGVLAFNAVGAHLTLATLRARADTYASALAPAG
jgi:aminoglycoside phosphotransferase (APT) family kinase protein